MGHIREYTRGEVRRFLEYSGFVMRHHRFADYSAPRGKRQTAKFVLARMLPSWFLSFHEVVAEKIRPMPEVEGEPIPITWSQ
jgi:hypothetical protein